MLASIAACVPLQLAYTHLPVMQTVFGSTDLSALEWAKAIGAGLLVFCGSELEDRDPPPAGRPAAGNPLSAVPRLPAFKPVRTP